VTAGDRLQTRDDADKQSFTVEDGEHTVGHRYYGLLMISKYAINVHGVNIKKFLK